MAQKEVEYVVRLGKTDRYRSRHIRKQGRIVRFVVQYETQIGEKWHAVVRYDTAHGMAHRDLLTRAGEVTKIPIFTRGYNEALTFAENDLKANWALYKERFLRE